MFVWFCSEGLLYVYVAVVWPSICSLDPLFFWLSGINFFGKAELGLHSVFITPKEIAEQYCEGLLV